MSEAQTTTRTYFGTDGIRGRTGDDHINPEFMLRLGWAAGRVFASSRLPGASPRVVIGKDTRISGYMFESALEAGLAAAGVDCMLLGPMPTPAVAYLARTFHAVCGIVISASHNPYEDNGVKFFSATGEKLPDGTELAIERELAKPLQTVASDALGKAVRVEDAAGRYIEYCKRAFPEQSALNGLKLVVDCANGATYHVAPAVFRELDAEVVAIGVSPDGLNINRGCGSTSPQQLQQAVLDQNADMGIALDGDGDRLIMVDGDGGLVDGDELLGVIALHRHRQQSLKGGVVGTLMSNLGLELALKRHGIDFARAAVGDRYVKELMEKRGWQLGGESSGHLICLDKSTTGDGIISALQVLTALVESGRTLAEARKAITKLPQELVNVRLARSFDPDDNAQVAAAMALVTDRLGDKGRVLLRKSGTEPVVRVMVEGEDESQVAELARELAQAVELAADAA